jgi:integrase
LSKGSELVFPRGYRELFNTFRELGRKAAVRLQSPRLRSISLTTFRHWGATMTYYYIRDILLVQRLLGHKHIENTMKYTQLVTFRDDEFDVATATTVEEAKKTLAVGFEYVTEKNGMMLFGRPKRFAVTVG